MFKDCGRTDRWTDRHTDVDDDDGRWVITKAHLELSAQVSLKVPSLQLMTLGSTHLLVHDLSWGCRTSSDATINLFLHKKWNDNTPQLSCCGQVTPSKIDEICPLAIPNQMDGHTTDGQIDTHTDDQHDTIIPCLYCVVEKKKHT